MKVFVILLRFGCTLHHLTTTKTNKIARNLVDYEAGKTILETALGIMQSNKSNQLSLL